MMATELMEAPQGSSLGVSLGHESVDGYEQRLLQWGCSKCIFFEKRVFRSRLPPEDLDAYIVCRFAGELVDLIGEATACPKAPKLRGSLPKPRVNYGKLAPCPTLRRNSSRTGK